MVGKCNTSVKGVGVVGDCNTSVKGVGGGRRRYKRFTAFTSLVFSYTLSSLTTTKGGGGITITIPTPGHRSNLTGALIVLPLLVDRTGTSSPPCPSWTTQDLGSGSRLATGMSVVSPPFPVISLL